MYVSLLDETYWDGVQYFSDCCNYKFLCGIFLLKLRDRSADDAFYLAILFLDSVN